MISAKTQIFEENPREDIQADVTSCEVDERVSVVWSVADKWGCST